MKDRLLIFVARKVIVRDEEFANALYPVEALPGYASAVTSRDEFMSPVDAPRSVFLEWNSIVTESGRNGY